MKRIRKESRDLDFEKKLYIALKSHGFLFPTTDEEVEEFERKIGNTEMELPSELKEPDIILRKGSESDNKIIPEDFEIKMAAFNANEDIGNNIDWNDQDNEDKNI